MSNLVVLWLLALLHNYVMKAESLTMQSSLYCGMRKFC